MPTASRAAALAVPIVLSACVVVIDGGGSGNASGSASLRSDFAQTAPRLPTEASLDAFAGIDASAGVRVIVVPGDAHAVAADEDARRHADYAVEDGEFRATCRRVETRRRGWDCAGRHDGVRGTLTVTAPDIASLEASSGAEIEVGGAMSASSLTVRASSGAVVDARRIDADAVEAKASSGGSVRVSAKETLVAKASSGGSVRYEGDPRVERAESSGGSVRRD